MLLNRHPENEVKLKRIIKFIVVYAPNYRQRQRNVSVTLVSNELIRPCTCETDSAFLNEVKSKGNNVFDFLLKRAGFSHRFLKFDIITIFQMFHWILVFQTNDASVKDIVTFYKIWHRINNSANVNFYTITLRPTYMVVRG